MSKASRTSSVSLVSETTATTETAVPTVLPDFALLDAFDARPVEFLTTDEGTVLLINALAKLLPTLRKADGTRREGCTVTELHKSLVSEGKTFTATELENGLKASPSLFPSVEKTGSRGKSVGGFTLDSKAVREKFSAK